MKFAWGVAILAAVATISTTGCTRYAQDAQAVAAQDASGAPAAATEESECTPVDAPLTTVDTEAGEVVIKIPQPAGWQRFTQMDSQLVRFAMRNEELQANGFAANAVITYESAPAGASEDLDGLFSEMWAAIEQLTGGKKVAPVSRNVCGLPAEVAEYDNPMTPVPATALAIVYDEGDRTHIVALNVVCPLPENATCMDDVEMVINGLQVLPPSSR